jgi:hypothetical protein
VKVFTSIGIGLDFLFGRVASTARGVLTAPEFRRVIGVGVASAIAGASPELTKAAAIGSHTELLNAAWTGFLTGAAGATVSLLHRLCDDAPSPPPPTESTP